jgi:competence protein ComEA
MWFQQMPIGQRAGVCALALVGFGALGAVGRQHLEQPAPIVFQAKEAPSPAISAKPTESDSPLAEPPAAVQEPDTQAAPPKELVVHVTGEVKQSGIYKLQPGDRVYQAIEKAGGSTSNADLTNINLAAKASDGLQIYVPKKGAPEELGKVAESIAGGEAARSLASRSEAGPSTASGSSGSSAKAMPAPGSISLNTAGSSELQRLPGVGPATAEKILDYRRQHGGFTSIDEVLSVKGIGPKKLQAMRKYLRL